jgi:hypothetical protein
MYVLRRATLTMLAPSSYEMAKRVDNLVNKIFRSAGVFNAFQRTFVLEKYRIWMGLKDESVLIMIKENR